MAQRQGPSVAERLVTGASVEVPLRRCSRFTDEEWDLTPHCVVNLRSAPLGVPRTQPDRAGWHRV